MIFIQQGNAQSIVSLQRLGLVVRCIQQIRIALWHFCWIAALLLTFYPIITQAANSSDQANTADVRILIDISGSMKKNDPNNLRQPALRLLLDLLPTGAKAGVWTFGKYVNMLVPLDTVDEKWKQAAKVQANRISSVALFTNIGEAMELASYNWHRPATVPRSMILLTDGMVDIDEQQVKNTGARNEILNDILPRLKSWDVKIHTVALSDNADKELLSTLALATGGSFSTIDEAKALLKVFVKAFDQSIPQDQVPLKDNRFAIDAQVKEFTVLVFRQPNSPITQLITPKGKVISDKSKNKTVTWFHEDSFDLVTIKTPQVGEWQIKAEIDEDNRVTVLSDLQLHIKDIPNHMVVGSNVNLEAFMTEQGAVIKRPQFLSLTKMKLMQQVYHDDEQTQDLSHLIADPFGSLDAVPKSGVFALELDENILVPGTHHLEVVVDGKTFQRKQKRFVTVYKQVVQVNVEQQQDTATESVMKYLAIYPVSGLFDPKQTMLSVKVRDPKASVSRLDTSLEWVDDHWQLPVNPTAGVGEYKVRLRIKGDTLGSGTSFEVKHPLVTVAYAEQDIPQVVAEPEMEPQEQEPIVAQQLEPEITEDEEPIEQTEIEEDEVVESSEILEEDWTDDTEEKEIKPGYLQPKLMLGMALAIGNILVIFIIWIIYRSLMKRRRNKETDIDDENDILVMQSEKSIVEQIKENTVEEPKAPETEMAEEAIEENAENNAEDNVENSVEEDTSENEDLLEASESDLPVEEADLDLAEGDEDENLDIENVLSEVEADLEDEVKEDKEP